MLKQFAKIGLQNSDPQNPDLQNRGDEQRRGRIAARTNLDGEKTRKEDQIRTRGRTQTKIVGRIKTVEGGGGGHFVFFLLIFFSLFEAH